MDQECFQRFLKKIKNSEYQPKFPKRFLWKIHHNSSEILPEPLKTFLWIFFQKFFMRVPLRISLLTFFWIPYKIAAWTFTNYPMLSVSKSTQINFQKNLHRFLQKNLPGILQEIASRQPSNIPIKNLQEFFQVNFHGNF